MRLVCFIFIYVSIYLFIFSPLPLVVRKQFEKSLTFYTFAFISTVEHEMFVSMKSSCTTIPSEQICYKNRCNVLRNSRKFSCMQTAYGPGSGFSYSQNFMFHSILITLIKYINKNVGAEGFAYLAVST